MSNDTFLAVEEDIYIFFFLKLKCDTRAAAAAYGHAGSEQAEATDGT